ncbi:membrane lipoprotein lipid attachment site-containing protein [Flavobacterium ustbae]|uniref:membrane lipoprotein lipid attachment site-containing protein n=1 Tax=Flavobacterium ustbae TaxID=2488790 RepID=UPI000F7B5E81|nr:membrane lipoprotein lipid attachment site-containing protein [Flavobacterium ustbae]
MKKILCLFGALTLLLTSCSSDESPSNGSTDSVFLKKTISTYSDGSKVTTNYTYNGNKIVSIIDDSGESNAYYTYTGDLITKLEYKLPGGTVEQVNTYAYSTDGKLTTFVRIDPEMDWGNKEVYTYNTDGTVTVKEYIGDATTQTTLNSTGTVKFSNGEVVEMINDTHSSHTYTYDTKNNPLKNVAGWNKINFTDAEANDVLHNMLTDKAEGELWYSYTYTYNDANYPVKAVESIEEETVEFFY